MNKENISLIINCKTEDIPTIDASHFDEYFRIYYNVYPDDKEYFNQIIDGIETEYYSVWDFDNDYKNIDNLEKIFNNKSYIENPDISVIVCLYNTKPELFKDCINGLDNQTFKNFEVLIINDGSDKYYNENRYLISQLKDNRFIWINKKHSGKSQTLNLGLEKSRGKYIAINDSDDISFSERLEYQYNFLETNVEYDYISNNMIRMQDLTVFPNNFKKSQKVTKDIIHYCTNHPCSMFNKNILKQIPFLFSQFYDSYEDCVFHYICFYYDIKMYYDNKILMKYAYCPDTQVHYDNITGFKHDAHYKITFTTFNINRKQSDFGIYLILFDDKLWTNVEIEKTLLNIRISSNNVNIYILYNNKFNLHVLKTICDKYEIKSYIEFQNQYSIFNLSYYNYDISYIGIISKPVRFYNQDWDIHIQRKLDVYPWTIIQSVLFDIEKINDNTYKNESGTLNKKYNYGERLTPLCEQLTEKNEKHYVISTNEYLKEIDIPLISNDNIFFLKTNVWQNMLNNICEITTYELSNVFISYILYKCFKQQPKIDLDNEIGTIFYNKNIINYYNNYKLFVYQYLNETIYLHEQLFNDICKYNNIELNILSNNSPINDFIKKQNKQPWNL